MKAATTEATARKTSSRLVEGLEFQVLGLLSVMFSVEVRSFAVSGSLRIYRGLSFDEAADAVTDKSWVSGDAKAAKRSAMQEGHGMTQPCPVNRNTVNVSVHQLNCFSTSKLCLQPELFPPVLEEPEDKPFSGGPAAVPGSQCFRPDIRI